MAEREIYSFTVLVNEDNSKFSMIPQKVISGVNDEGNSYENIEGFPEESTQTERAEALKLLGASFEEKGWSTRIYTNVRTKEDGKRIINQKLYCYPPINKAA